MENFEAPKLPHSLEHLPEQRPKIIEIGPKLFDKAIEQFKPLAEGEKEKKYNRPELEEKRLESFREFCKDKRDLVYDAYSASGYQPQVFLDHLFSGSRELSLFNHGIEHKSIIDLNPFGSFLKNWTINTPKTEELILVARFGESLQQENKSYLTRDVSALIVSSIINRSVSIDSTIKNLSDKENYAAFNEGLNSSFNQYAIIRDLIKRLNEIREENQKVAEEKRDEERAEEKRFEKKLEERRFLEKLYERKRVRRKQAARQAMEALLGKIHTLPTETARKALVNIVNEPKETESSYFLFIETMIIIGVKLNEEKQDKKIKEARKDLEPPKYPTKDSLPLAA